MRTTRGNPLRVADIVHSLADCALDEGMIDEASRLYHESLDIAVRTSTFEMIAYCLGGLAAVEARRARPESAARLWGAVQNFERAGLYPALEDNERSRYERALSGVAPSAPADGAGWADVLAGAVTYARSLKPDG
jgi:hypothetical protein